MRIKKEDLDKVIFLLQELSNDSNNSDMIDISDAFSSFKKNKEISSRIIFRTEGQDQEEYIKNWLKLNLDLYEGSDWKPNPSRYYLFLDKGKYIGGSTKIDSYKGFEKITFEELKEYMKIYNKEIR